MAGRNDPCPCGSGKKYKQCCLVKQSEDQSRQVKERQFFDRKYKLTRDFYSFLAQKNGGEWTFDHQKYNLFDSSMGNLKEGFGNMREFFFREYDNGMRGIDCFLEERGKRYSGEEREMLERWRSMKISCFQMVDLYEHGTVIEDIWSGERYHMPYCETMVKLPPWSVAAGMIEPFFDDWCIHGAMMWGHPNVKTRVLDRVRELQEEAIRTSGRTLPPSDIIAGNYSDMINMCHRVEKEYGGRNERINDTSEQVYVTRKYACENFKLLADMLLDKEDQFILVPGANPVQEKFVISRAEKLDAIFDMIPADRWKRLGLDEIQISYDLGRIEIEQQIVTVVGWWNDEMESMLDLLDSEMACAVGLTIIDEQRESHQLPKNLVFKGCNIITDKELSKQEVSAYGHLPELLQWFLAREEKHPEENPEMLVRSREYEQYRANPEMADLNLLRVALGLSNNPYYSGKPN
ncbi:YecA family protein [Paenibacillus sp. strain BS8-2]